MQVSTWSTILKHQTIGLSACIFFSGTRTIVDCRWTFWLWQYSLASFNVSVTSLASFFPLLFVWFTVELVHGNPACLSLLVFHFCCIYVVVLAVLDVLWLFLVFFCDLKTMCTPEVQSIDVVKPVIKSKFVLQRSQWLWLSWEWCSGLWCSCALSFWRLCST